MTRIIAIAFMLSMGFALPAAAVDAHHPPGAKAAADTAALTEGEVRKVDKETKKITIRHGPIANLDMPPMTMVFQVKDPTMLDQVKVGDKIRSAADKIGGAFTVVQIKSE